MSAEASRAAALPGGDAARALTDARVPAFWRGLGLPGLADVHVHFYPERMLRKVWRYFSDAGRYGVDWPITYRWGDRERLAYLAALGVRAYPALNYAHRPGMAADLTAWSLRLAAGAPGCLPSGTFFPEPGVADQVDSALAAGVRIFKVHLQVGAFDPRDDLLDPVWGRLAETGTPVVVHAGSGPLPGPYTGPGPIGEVLSRHPRLTAVVAHLGMPEYGDFFALAERHERVHLDTTMAFTDFAQALAPFPLDLRPRLRALGLAGRVLLGSDFPNIPYPYAHQLEALARLDLGDDWLRAVCWHSAARLLSLPAPADPLRDPTPAPQRRIGGGDSATDGAPSASDAARSASDAARSADDRAWRAGWTT